MTKKVLPMGYVLGSHRAARVIRVALEIAQGRKMNTSAISRATGIRRTFFPDWKNGRRTLNQEQILKIKDVLGVSEDHLLLAQFDRSTIKGIMIDGQGPKAPLK